MEQKFKKAAYLIRNGPPRDASNEEKLQFYSFFKQATEGGKSSTRVIGFLILRRRQG
jgi:acyl-CoA-binding protein